MNRPGTGELKDSGSALIWPLSWIAVILERFPRTSLFVALGLSLASAWGIQFLRLDNSLSALFQEDDRSLEAYEKFQTAFGREDFVVAILEDPIGIFTARGQKALFELSDRVQRHTLVTASRSIPQIVRGLDPEVQAPEDAADLLDLKETFGISPLFVEDLVSADGTVAADYGRLKPARPSEVAGLIAQLRSVPIAPDQRLVIAGPATINSELDQGALEDGRRLLPLAVLCASLLLFFARGRAGLMASLAALLATLAALGALGWAGRTINLITVGLPPLLYIMNLAASLHLLNAPRPGQHKGVHALEAVGNPVFFSFLTTGAGFLALATSEIRPIQEMGLYGCLGLVGGVPILILGICGLLEVTNIGRTVKPSATLQAVLRWVTRLGANRRILWGILALAGAIIGFIGMGRLESSTAALNFLPAGSPVREAIRFAEKHLMGFTVTELIVEGPAGTFVDPAAVRAVDQLARDLEASHPTARVRGIQDFLKHMNMMEHSEQGVSLDRFQVPESAEVIREYLDGLPDAIKASIRQVLGEGRGVTRLFLRVEALEGTEYAAVLGRWRAITNRFEKSTGFKTQITGIVPMLTRMQFRLIDGLRQSMILALIVIFLALFLVTGDLSLATLGMVPNILPVVTTMGCLGFLGIPLDAGTAMVASISLGIVVDDSLHLLYGLKQYHGDLIEVVNESGPALVWTTLSGALGFSVLGFSKLLPLAKFGVLVSGTLLMALIADLLLIPAFCARRSNRGVVAQNSAISGGGSDDGEST